MALSELNEPSHPWYQKRNHVRIPRLAESKKYLDPDYVGGASGFRPVLVNVNGTITATGGGSSRPTLVNVNGTITASVG
jgi:hypothetical protein